ncbi:MAG: hypothetical protein E7047_03980 [Lentisphaerae bacterium]|nr:hypothetical protein [Lentisphaerota bacterium]
MNIDKKQNCSLFARIIGFLFFIAIMVFFMVRCDTAPNNAEAWYIAKQFAKKDLKTPATADFPALHADGVTVTDLGDGQYSVSGYVDVENSFGAKVRQHFIVEVQKRQKGDTWSSGGVVWLK